MTAGNEPVAAHVSPEGASALVHTWAAGHVSPPASKRNPQGALSSTSNVDAPLLLICSFDTLCAYKSGYSLVHLCASGTTRLLLRPNAVS